MSCNPPPNAQVQFRPEVRPRLGQLLGPAPEQEDAFHRHPDGTPRERPKRDQSFTKQLDEQAPKQKGRKSHDR